VTGALVHDVLDGALPDAYEDVDAIYTEPPWPGQVPAWNALVARIVAEATRLDVPLVMALPFMRPVGLPEPYERARGMLLHYGVPCTFWSYGIRTGGGPSSRVLGELAERFDCLGDPCCGTGTTGRVAEEHGKRSVLSDIRPRGEA
jgi:hypothetical protein